MRLSYELTKLGTKKGKKRKESSSLQAHTNNIFQKETNKKKPTSGQRKKLADSSFGPLFLWISERKQQDGRQEHRASGSAKVSNDGCSCSQLLHCVDENWKLLSLSLG